MKLREDKGSLVKFVKILLRAVSGFLNIELFFMKYLYKIPL